MKKRRKRKKNTRTYKIVKYLAKELHKVGKTLLKRRRGMFGK